LTEDLAVNIQRRPALVALSLVASVALVLSACGGGETSGGGLSGAVVIDGSSTVEPLSAAAGELFEGENPDVHVTVGTSGTGGGFTKFCAGETDISDASRPIKDEEKAKCDEKGIAFTELQVANDALTIVVNTENTWAECLTVEQLKAIWEPNSQVKNWNQVDPSFPDEPLSLYGAGADSGTFDYFTAEIVGEEGSSRTDYNPSEDDNVTVQGVSGAKGALGYFGFSYFEENESKLKALKVDGGDGCVEPSLDTAQDGTYQPLSRPLFIYPSDTGLAKPQVLAFVEFYLEQNDAIVEAAKFVPLTDEQKTKTQADLEALKSKVGS
jgi:phosphate transport system substrate-binding protein